MKNINKEILINEITILVSLVLVTMLGILNSIIGYQQGDYLDATVITFITIIMATLTGCTCRNMKITINEVFKENNSEDNK